LDISVFFLSDFENYFGVLSLLCDDSLNGFLVTALSQFAKSQFGTFSIFASWPSLSISVVSTHRPHPHPGAAAPSSL
jgi:hypothetical protein